MDDLQKAIGELREYFKSQLDVYPYRKEKLTREFNEQLKSLLEQVAKEAFCAGELHEIKPKDYPAFNNWWNEQNLKFNGADMDVKEIIAKEPIVYGSATWDEVPDQDKVGNSIIVLPQSYKEKRHVSDFKWEVLFYDGSEAKYLGLFWEKKHAVIFANSIIKKLVEGYII